MAEEAVTEDVEGQEKPKKKATKGKGRKKKEKKEEWEESDGEAEWSDVKACKREIVGIYTRGTFNPALVQNGEK